MSFTEQDAVNSVKNGNSAMIPVWWWVRGQLIDPKTSKLTEEQVGFAPMPSFEGGKSSTYINCWIYALTRNAKRKDAAMEFISYVTHPALERDILVDPKENDVVATQWSSLRDPEVNRRFGGMHNFAAEALQTTKAVPYTAEWPQNHGSAGNGDVGGRFGRQERQRRLQGGRSERPAHREERVAYLPSPARGRRWQAKPDG